MAGLPSSRETQQTFFVPVEESLHPLILPAPVSSNFKILCEKIVCKCAALNFSEWEIENEANLIVQVVDKEHNVDAEEVFEEKESLDIGSEGEELQTLVVIS
eukprot:GFUD01026332.1.p1 GENE.GFUD01026332.1~~GFUD01026332.1.p1  ORF type:complete len:102 (-),score=13.90 GFUD01026332.1:38-343(-)